MFLVCLKHTAREPYNSPLYMLVFTICTIMIKKSHKRDHTTRFMTSLRILLPSVTMGFLLPHPWHRGGCPLPAVNMYLCWVQRSLSSGVQLLFSEFFLFLTCYSYPFSRTVQLVETAVGLLLLGVRPYSGMYALGNRFS